MSNITETKVYHEKRYFYLLDLLRVMSMVAIISFHANEFIFYTLNFPLTEKTNIFPYFDIYSRWIPFSGQTIIALSFFLWGIRKKSFDTFALYLMLFIFGHMIVTANFNDPSMIIKNIEWDIYPFLAISFLVIHFSRKCSASSKKALILVSGLLLFIQPNIIQSNSFLNIFNGMLWSSCSSGGSGAWPLFPWLALPVLFYHGGEVVSEKMGQFETFQMWEKLFWPIILCFSLFALISIYPGSLYGVHIGSKFYCQILNLAPMEFWSYFIWVLFILRISLIKSFNVLISKKWLFKNLRKLYWNSHFGLTYICHIILLYLGAQFDKFFFENPLIFDLYFIMLFPLPELMARGFKKIFQSLRSIKK
jgi:hypothetical protein